MHKQLKPFLDWRRWKKAVVHRDADGKPIVSEEEFLLRSPQKISDYTLEKHYFSLYGSDEPIYLQRYAKDLARDRKKFIVCINAKIAKAKRRKMKALLREKEDYLDFHESKSNIGSRKLELDAKKNAVLVTRDLVNKNLALYREEQNDYASLRIADLSWQTSFIHRELFGKTKVEESDFDPRILWVNKTTGKIVRKFDKLVQHADRRATKPRKCTARDVRKFIEYHNYLQRTSQRMYGLYYYVYSEYDCECYIKRYVDPSFEVKQPPPLLKQSHHLVEKYDESIIYKQYFMPRDIGGAFPDFSDYYIPPERADDLAKEQKTNHRTRLRELAREGDVYLMHEPVYNIFGCATFGRTPRFDTISLSYGTELMEYPVIDIIPWKHTVENVLDCDPYKNTLNSDWEYDPDEHKYITSKPFYCKNSDDVIKCNDSFVVWHFGFRQHMTKKHETLFEDDLKLYKNTMKELRDTVYNAPKLADRFRETQVSDIVLRAAQLYESALAAFYKRPRWLAQKNGRFSDHNGMLNSSSGLSIVHNDHIINYCQVFPMPKNKRDILVYYDRLTPCKWVVDKVPREYILRMFTIAMAAADKCTGGDADAEMWRLLDKERKWCKVSYFRTSMDVDIPPHKPSNEVGIRFTLAQLEHIAQHVTRGEYHMHFKFLLEYYVFAQMKDFISSAKLSPQQHKVLRKIVLMMLIYDYNEHDADGSPENDCLGMFTQLFQEIYSVGMTYPMFSQIKDYWSPAAIVMWEQALCIM